MRILSLNVTTILQIPL